MHCNGKRDEFKIRFSRNLTNKFTLKNTLLRLKFSLITIRENSVLDF